MDTQSQLSVPGRLVWEHTSSLRRHILQCRVAQGPLFALAQVAERIHLFAAPRFVTTVVAICVLLTVGCGGF